MADKIIKTGPAVILVSGSGRIHSLISEELQGEEASPDAGIDLKIIFLGPGEKFHFEPKYHSGSLSFDSGNFMKKEDGYTYLVKGIFSEEKIPELIISTGAAGGLINSIKTFLLSDSNQDRINGVKNSIMSYSLFWYIFHLVLLRKKAAFIHSSVLEKDGKGIILAGTGGSGKTSIAFKMLEKEGYRYLAEDFGIIDASGKVYFNPKYMSIYGTDVKYGQKDLVRYINEKMKAGDKLQWELMKIRKRNPMRKIPPHIMLGKERICAETRAAAVYFLSRYTEEGLKIKENTAEDISEKCLNASFRELKTFTEILNQVHAAGHKDTEFPQADDIINRTMDVYMKAFGGIKK